MRPAGQRGVPLVHGDLGARPVQAAGQAEPAEAAACHGHSMIVDPWGAILAERTEPTPVLTTRPR